MKKEAVAIIAAIVIILQIILGYLKTGVVDADAGQNALSAVQIIVVAVGALWARRKVFSENTHNLIVGELANPSPEDAGDTLWP